MSRSAWTLLAGTWPVDSRAALVRLSAWSIVEALPAVSTGVLLAQAIDLGFGARRPLVGLAFLSLLGVAHVVSSQATGRTFPLVAALVEPIRDALVERVAAGVLTTAATGGPVVDTAVVSRLTQQVETVRDVLAGLLFTTRRTVFAVVAAVVGLASLSGALLALVLPPVVAALAVFAALVRPLQRRQRAQVIADEQVAADTGQFIAGLRDVVAFRAQQHVISRGTQVFERSRSAARAMAAMTALRTATVAIGAHLAVLFLLIGAPDLLARGVTAGAIVGAVAYVSTSVEPTLRALTLTVGGSALRLAVALGRMAEVSAPRSSALDRAPSVAPAGTDLELRGVTFAYGAAARPVVRDLDLRISAGSHWAVVGVSGIGKSTLAGLLSGLDVPQRGAVLVGGAPLAEQHRLVTLVPQDPYVFDGSLRDNLRYLRPEVADADIDAAVAVLAAQETVRRAGGYDAHLTAAVLGPAERQLIALVRAYLSTAPVTVLDEATCHLAPGVEARVEHAFARRRGTLVVIAHRMSSAIRAEHVLLMDGDVAATGTHESLLAGSGVYADLVGWWERPVRREGQRGSTCRTGIEPGGWL